MDNPNCDGAHCISESGQVRMLPLSEEATHGNVILCHSCYTHEIAWRRERNLNLGKEYAFALPSWEELKIY